MRIDDEALARCRYVSKLPRSLWRDLSYVSALTIECLNFCFVHRLMQSIDLQLKCFPNCGLLLLVLLTTDELTV
jgi:hypothetical protein